MVSNEKEKRFEKVVEWDWSYFKSTKARDGKKFTRGDLFLHSFFFFISIPISIYFIIKELIKSRKVYWREMR